MEGRRRVVVTGLGAVTPLGVGAGALWQGWTAGTVALDGGVGACADFEPLAHLSVRETRRLDRFSQLAVTAATEAIEQAGWAPELPYAPARVGCVIGTAVGGVETIQQETAARALGERGVSTLTVPKLMGNAAPAHIAVRHGLCGPSFATVASCAGGAHALGLSLRMIQYGEADAMVCGGSEAPLSAVPQEGMMALGAVSPTGTSRPFDARRDGMVMAEGAGAVVLEEADAAQRRGARVLGELLGFGQTTDAHHITTPEPSGAAAAAAVTCALEDGGLSPADVDYVNAHGTGTSLSDASETLALKRALGDDARRVPISSLKSAIGHMIGAAGAVDAVATLQALRERVAPPTLSLEEPDAELDLDYVPCRARELDVRGERAVGLSDAFGFGGHNAVLAFAA